MDHNKLWKILKEMGTPDHLTCLLRNLYVGLEAPFRTIHGIMTDSKLGKAYNKAINCHPYVTYMQSVCLCTQSCPTLCDPMDCSLPRSSVNGILLVRMLSNTGVACHFLLEGIFLTQRSNLHLLHWQGDSLTLSHRGSPLC